MNIPITLLFLRPGEEWTLDGDSYSGLTWLSDTPMPTENEILDAWPSAQIAADKAAAMEKAAARAALLERLGITEEEAALLREAGI